MEPKILPVVDDLCKSIIEESGLATSFPSMCHTFQDSGLVLCFKTCLIVRFVSIECDEAPPLSKAFRNQGGLMIPEYMSMQRLAEFCKECLTPPSFERGRYRALF